MTAESSGVLEGLLRDNDLGWMIDTYNPRERAIPALVEKLASLSDIFRARFGDAPSFSPEDLRDEAARNPHKIVAFLQALRESSNLEMLVMVCRILQGLSIREVAMSYREVESFSLSVTLAPFGDVQSKSETYKTDNIFDAVLLRHFGITTVDERPLFDGFFPSRKR